MKKEDFYHDEFRQVGTDYASVSEVAAYDERMRKMRDVDAENSAILEKMNLPAQARILEIGTGTGAFARASAKRNLRVDALDISRVMLEYASAKARSESLSIRFIQGGFLSFEGEKNAYDGIVTSLALHHLSDVWKAVALRNIHNMLKPGGVFFLADVVFDWGNESPEAYFSNLTRYAPGSRENFVRHIADEFSTLDWIMRGLLERAGLSVEEAGRANPVVSTYFCRKK